MESRTHTPKQELKVDKAAVHDFVGAMTTIAHLATEMPRAEYKLAQGQTLIMSLKNQVGIVEPLVTMADKNQPDKPSYFRPLTEENWPAFVRAVKVCMNVTRLQQRIPELAPQKVDFAQRVVACPESISKRREPILMACSQYGYFEPDFSTLDETLEQLSRHAKKLSLETQPA